MKLAALIYLWLAIGITAGFFVTEAFYRLLLVAAGVTLHLLRLKTLQQGPSTHE